MPPYVIFNDRTLHEMVERHPRNLTELLQVNGVGTAKAERYGAAFLDVLLAARDGAEAGESGGEAEGGASGDDERMQAIKAQHPQAYEPWTQEEEERLLALQRRGATLDEMAGELGRQPGGITSRLRRLLGDNWQDPGATPLPVRQNARSGRAGTGTTAQITLELHREGLSIDEIAARRGLRSRTIAQHLADAVAKGEVADVGAWVSDADLARIRRIAAGRPLAALRPLREALDNTLTYDQLTVARAFLNRELDGGG